MTTTTATMASLNAVPDVPECSINGTVTANISAMDYNLADTPKLVAGSVVFFVVFPFIVFDFRYFPIGTTPAIMFGAMLMVVCRIVTQQEVYDVIGRHGNMTTIYLLLGMMLVAQFFEREQLLMKVLRRVLKPHFTFGNYIWRVCLLSFIVSALFTNDASCAILTPLLLKVWEVHERPTSELESILLGIATSANIGSVISVFGNPQMALIAARTSAPAFKSSRLDLRMSLLYLGPPAVVGFLLNVCFLLLHQRLRTRRIENSKLISEASHSEQEMAGLTATPKDGRHANGVLKYDRDDFLYEGVGNERAVPCQLETIPEDEVLEISSGSRDGMTSDGDVVSEEPIVGDADADAVTSETTTEDEEEYEYYNKRQRSLGEANVLTLDVEYTPGALQGNPGGSNSSLSRSLEEHGLKVSERAGIYRSLSAFSAADFLPPRTGQPAAFGLGGDEQFMPSESVIFQTFICLMVVAIVAILLASGQEVLFDMGLVAMGAAILSVTVDALINRRMTFLVMRRVDWSIIMMFLGMFVYMHGLCATGLPRWAWYELGFGDSSGLAAGRLALLALLVLIGLNVFGSVPVTLVVLEQLLPCADQFGLVLYLAWCGTVGGNLTLFGSVANLIVSQKGQQTLKYRLTFFTYFRYGCLTTLFIVSSGMLMLYGLLRIH